MLSKSHSSVMAGPPGSENFSSSKKKKAPPRPPPPTATNSMVRPSQSFRTAGELQSQKISSFGQRSSISVDTNRGGSDLIDFSTPDDGNVKQVESLGSKLKDPAEFKYRVGASIFYVRSQLKNPTPSSQSGNPFSPPRPSAQAMLGSPAKHVVASSTGQQGNSFNTRSTLYSNVPAQQPSHLAINAGSNLKYKPTPTIIKRPNENNNNNNNITTNKSASDGGGSKMGGGSLRSSSGSSDWSDYSQTSSQPPQQQLRYGNIPSAWDEPPVQHREPTKQSSIAVLPTIIKPTIASKPSLLPKPSIMGQSTTIVSTTTTVTTNQNPSSDSGWTNFANQMKLNAQAPLQQRNYYDDPPDSDDFDDDDQDDSFVSPPMPTEPPPPPPPDVAFDSTDVAPPYIESTYLHHHQRGNDTDRAYAIALYDYLSDVEGDLPLQVGDLVYLIKKIDEEWLYGQCAGVEGMFPTNYVNVVVQLQEESEISQPEVVAETTEQSFDPQSQQQQQVYYADAIYKFDAETDGDLSLRPGDMVKIFGKMNEDWLYGEVANKVGQFPSSFVHPVPLADLPIIPSGS